MFQINYEKFKDKVYGGWMGKCAGGMIGAKAENNKSLMHYTFDNVFPDKIPPNDDLDLQILYLQEVLEKKGLSFDTLDLAEAFARYNMCWANEYRIAIRNINRKIYPPASGWFNNDYFKNSMGCPIRSELWGMIAAGNPKLSCEFVERDGRIDHSTDSVEMEKYLASVESLAFFKDDIPALLKEALQYVEKNSRVHAAVGKVFEIHAQEKDWRIAREYLIGEFGSSDASYCVVNLAIIILALLYGKGNFNDTMLIAVNCGYDTDCTSATCGSILGIIMGRKKIPEEWVEKIGDRFVVGTVDLKRERNRISELAEDTARIAYAAVRDKVNDNLMLTAIPDGFAESIPTVQPKVRIFANYMDLPVISAKRDCKFELLIVNEFEQDISGSLELKGKYVITDVTRQDVRIQAGGKTKIPICVQLDAKDWVPNNVIVKAEFQYSNATVCREVGMQVEAKYKIIGPFFDNYDTAKYDHDIHNGCMPKDLFDMFNNHVNIEREYIAENFENLEQYPAKIMLAAQDILPIEQYIGYRGSCCVYLVRDIWCEEEKSVHMFFGDTTPYKVFLNGKLISWGNRFCAWMPLNQVAEVKLQKGRNRFVYKLTRYNGGFIFSTFFSKLAFGNGVAVSFQEENI